MMVERNLTGPKILTFEPTDQCVGRCIMCNNWCVSGKSLDPKKCLDVVDEVSRMGTEHINFAGGDPLLFPEIFQLIRRIKSYGMESALVTMGTLIRQGNVRELVDSGIDEVRISLDSPNPSKNDEIRGVKSAYEKGVRGIELLLEERARSNSKKPTIVVNMTIMQMNFDDIEEMAIFCENLGVDRLTFSPVVQVSDETVEASNLLFGEEVSSRQFQPYGGKRLLLNEDEIAKVRDILRNIKNNGTLTISTNAGSILEMTQRATDAARGRYLKYNFESQSLACKYPYTRLVIDAAGYVFPCSPIRYNLGNITSQSIEEIWNGERRKDMKGVFSVSGWPEICYTCCSLKPPNQ